MRESVGALVGIIEGFVGGYDHLRMALNCVLVGIIESVLVGMIGGGVGGYV